MVPNRFDHTAFGRFMLCTLAFLCYALPRIRPLFKASICSNS